jgi:hypothetical protein
MAPNEIKPWTFFKDKNHRLFIIVDYNVGGKAEEPIVLMEVKQYLQHETRQFGKMPAKDFARRVDKGILMEVVPRV